MYAGTQDSGSHCLCSVALTPNGHEIGYNPAAAVTSAPAIANGIVYVGAGNGQLDAIDASTGTGLWSARTNNTIYSSPAVSDGMVFVGSYDGRVYAYALEGGAAAVYHRNPTPPSFTALHPNLRLRPIR
jgi:outer membrane protein assembly factor BamB